MSDSTNAIENTLTRRDCLKQAGLTAGGLAVASSLASKAYANESNTIKVALVGCGNRGSGAAAQALSVGPHVKLWAMADAFDDRLESSLEVLKKGTPKKYDQDATASLADQIDVPKERQFVGLDAYRKAIDSGADVVIITGPPGYRPLHFEYAVNAGKHVFMEKPLATDGSGVRRILAAAESAAKQNLKVGVGLQRHHQTSYKQAMEKLHDGDLGRIVSMRSFWNGGPPAKQPYDRAKSSSEYEHQVRNWYFFDWLSGDHICEQHIHNLDICNWAKGEPPVAAEGMGGRLLRTGKEYGNIFDHHAVIYHYADGTTMHSYCRQMSGTDRKIAEEIECTNGVATLTTSRATFTSGGQDLWKSERRRGKNAENPYQVEWDVLIDAVANDKPHNEAVYAAHSTMTAILGRMATYSGTKINFADALNSKRVMTTDAEDWAAAAPVEAQADGAYQIPIPGVTPVL